VSEPASYSLPEGVIAAHIALAGRYLAAHYVVPICRRIGPEDVVLRLAMHDDAEAGATIEADSIVEVLDTAGKWAWVACGPDGPSGYLQVKDIAPANAE